LIMNKLFSQLSREATAMRMKLVELSHQTKTAHLGSCLSIVDILITLYNGKIMNVSPDNFRDETRDRFILSKGHAANALYAVLAGNGFFPEEMLLEIGHPGSRLEEHPRLGAAPGIEATSGSLGHGLPIGAGMALAAKINSLDYRVFVLMSDGECNEGTVWEAALFAAKRKLNNLRVIIDFNK